MRAKNGQLLTVLYSCDLIEFGGKDRLYTTITDITQRANAEHLFAVAFEANPEIMTISNAADGRIIDANRRFLEYYGFAKQDVIGKSGEELNFWADPDDRNIYAEALRRDGHVRDYPILMRAPDGGTDHFRFATDTIEMGGVAAFLTVARRVTDEIAAKQALSESEERFRLLLESAPTPLMVTANGIYLYVNRLAAETFGWSQNELTGRPTEITFVNYSDRDAALVALAETGRLNNREMQFKRRDGSTFWALLSVNKVTYQGQSAHLAGLHDVTERRKLEEALRLSESRFQDFAEIGSDWLWEMDADLRYTYFSDRLRELTGISPDRSLGRTRQQAVRGDEEDWNWRRHQNDLANRKPFRDFRYTYTRDDGRVLHWSVSGKPIYDDKGKFQGYRSTGTDLTAEAEAHAKADELHHRFITAVENIGSSTRQVETERFCEP